VGLKEPPPEKLGCQEEEVGSKRRRRRMIVPGGPVEGEREEREKTTLTLHQLNVQLLTAHERSDLLPRPLFLLVDTDTLIFLEV